MSIPPLRQALAQHLGQVLTPEVAVAIELAAASLEDRAFEPASFGVLEHGAYRIGVERFTDVIGELHALHVEHWLETEVWRHRLPLNPDYIAMAAMERAGRCIQFTVRHQGVLVGNLRVFIHTSLHTQTRFASEDCLFIRKEHRGGFLAMGLIRFAERSLIAIGVDEIRVNSKVVNNADVLMRRMRYQPVALQFVKVLEVEP